MDSVVGNASCFGMSLGGAGVAGLDCAGRGGGQYNKRNFTLLTKSYPKEIKYIISIKAFHFLFFRLLP